VVKVYKPSPSHQKFLDILTEKNRPKKTANLMDEYLGDQREYQKAVDDGFQGTYEEFLRIKSMRENAAQGGVIGEGGMFRGQDMGTREGFAEAKFNDPSAGIKVGDDLGNGISQQRIKKDGSVVYRVYKGKVKGKQLESRSIPSYEDALAEREKYVPFKKGTTLSKKQIRNENKWKKANPNLNYDDLSDTVKYSIRKTGRTNLGTIGQGKANLFLTGEDSPFYNPLSKKGEKIAKHVYGTTDITDDRRLRINSGQTTMDTKPVKFEKGKDISLKMKRGSEEVTDIVFPNKQVEKDFIKAIKARVLQPQKAVVDFTNKELSELFDISEKQAGRAARYLINKLGLKYKKVPTSTSAEIIKKTRDSLAKTSSVLQEDRIRAAKTPILKEKNLKKKIDIAHRVSKKQMERLGLQFSTDTVGIDSRLINQIIVKPSEIKLNKLYTKQFNAFEKLKKNSNSTEAIKQLEDINKQVNDIVKSTSGRLVGISIDPKTLEPSFVGMKKKYSFSNVLGESMTMKELEILPEDEQRKFLNKQLPKAIDLEIKRGFVPNDFKNILSNKESQKSILEYTKKTAPELLGSIKKAIANPTSKASMKLMSAMPTVALPGLAAYGVYKYGEDILKDSGLVDRKFEQTASAGDAPLVEEGFTTAEKLAGAGTAAGLVYKYGKPILKVLGAPSLAAGLSIKELAKGEDANLGIAGAELLAPELARQAGVRGLLANPFQLAEKAAKFGKIGRGVASLARIPSLMTPVGLTLMGVEGVRMAKREQDRINKMKREEPEKYREYIDELESYLDVSA